LQVDIVEHGLLRAGEGLGHPLHDKGVLGGHRWSLSRNKQRMLKFDAPPSQAHHFPQGGIGNPRLHG
jgi:hypothetical protein